MRIVQLAPNLHFGDAVGNDMLALLDILEQAGADTEICAAVVDKRIHRKNVRAVACLPALQKEDILFYHMASVWDMARGIRALPCRKVMIYHNITPPQYFENYNPGACASCRDGLQQMWEFADMFDYVLADSEYNKLDLLAAGYRCPIDVLPIQIPFDDYRAEPDADVLEKYNDGHTNLLFVGRVAPNKMFEDVIKTFYYYQRDYDPDARLFLVGSSGGMELYLEYLKLYIAELGVKNVIFPGHISFAEILAYYRLADVFLCMSEHEGFCVPLLEAMYFDVPVVGRAAAAVPETLGGAGLLVEGRDCLFAAAAIDRVVRSPALRRQIVAAQRGRLADFAYEKVRDQFFTCLRLFAGDVV